MTEPEVPPVKTTDVEVKINQADASVLAVEWQSDLEEKISSGETFHEVISELINLYRKSDNPSKTIALAVTLEELCADEFGISHPKADIVSSVLRRVAPSYDAFLGTSDIATMLAKVVKKTCKKNDWLDVMTVGLHRTAKDKNLAPSTRRALINIIADGLESFVLSTLKRAKRFLFCG